ncbi:hypothetical protein Ae201684P_012492 [Aphanomyces euteiches]|uniref:Uncharacterized protein n=1 Tax=Aphanomyces euteiches TaxID=100861 RepID=A0A6G0WZ34_9STRA|nr:hypothetical protein Ae201684_010183 [Aphanomyces euteiches]KAH9076002.1 hypothetical protein Ae201684P_012492 [Aphanomyces euteiches]KAH9155274.1 hypothetical protein AeRB84_002742 [Aphanomyces euteiches]
MTIEAVLFDLDGTLIDMEMLSVETFIEVAGPGYTLDLHKRILGTPSHSWSRLIIDELKLDMTPEEMIHQCHVILGKKYASSVLLPGALNLVQSLAGQPVKVALATSSASSAVELKRAAHPALFEGFELIVCGDDPAVKRGKPNPDIFLVAAERLGIQDKSKCIVVEDSEHGVAAGKAAGMKVVAVPDTRFFTPVDIAERFGQADVILKSLDDWNSDTLLR